MTQARSFPSEEPSADLRQMAAAVRELFVALVQVGFTERQALAIVTELLKTVVGK